MIKKLVFVLVFSVLTTGSEAWAITGLGIGVRGGIVQGYRNDNLNSIPTGEEDWLENMPMVGAHLKVGTLRIIHLEASVEYAWKEQDIVLTGLGKTKFSVNDLSLNATAKYMFSFAALKPYVGAGAGVHKIAYGVSTDAYSVYIPEDESKTGFHGVGGVILSPPVFPLEFMAEAKYTTVQTEGASTRYATFLVGLTYKLP